MKKIVIVCPSCQKKMKISDKTAKYKCPHCGNIYKYTLDKKLIYSIKDVGIGFISTIKDIKYNITKKGGEDIYFVCSVASSKSHQNKYQNLLNQYRPYMAYSAHHILHQFFEILYQRRLPVILITVLP